MDNYDQMTRRNFLTRVTTLAGACVVVTSASMLSGCGGGEGGGNNPPPFSAFFTPPSRMDPDTAVQQAVATGQLPAGTSAATNKSAPLATLASTDAATVVAAVNAALPAPSGLPLPVTLAGNSQAGLKTAASLHMSLADVQAFVGHYLTAGMTTPDPNSQSGAAYIVVPTGSTVNAHTYTINGQTFTLPVLLGPDGLLIFDPILSLLPPNGAITGSRPVPQVQKNGTTGEGAAAEFNSYDGHTVFYTRAQAVGSTDANGNLSSATPSITQTNVGPGQTLISTNATSRAARTRGTGCVGLSFFYQFASQATLSNESVVQFFSLSPIFSFNLCSTGATGGSLGGQP